MESTKTRREAGHDHKKRWGMVTRATGLGWFEWEDDE